MGVEKTRDALHGIAELLLAGPQYRRDHTIRLRVLPGAIATVTEPELRADHLNVWSNGSPVPVRGASYQELGERLGVTAGAPVGLYHDGSGAQPPEHPELDPAEALGLLDALYRGDQALRAFAPEATPVLWPEHFDVGVTVDEVNYGVSPGDNYLNEPYMYVGPHKPREGEFWNAPFGAALPLAATVEEITAFFAEGQRAAS
ncbi:hypothetical protein [Catenulispora subtropica]|uniref:Uncharacterized protein n=1 Tax=Catenulispora subtropica TaxID=450798 RepID=A0ABP5BZN3_9ACTN